MPRVSKIIFFSNLFSFLTQTTKFCQYQLRETELNEMCFRPQIETKGYEILNINNTFQSLHRSLSLPFSSLLKFSSEITRSLCSETSEVSGRINKIWFRPQDKYPAGAVKTTTFGTSGHLVLWLIYKECCSLPYS